MRFTGISKKGTPFEKGEKLPYSIYISAFVHNLNVTHYLFMWVGACVWELCHVAGSFVGVYQWGNTFFYIFCLIFFANKYQCTA